MYAKKISWLKKVLVLMLVMSLALWRWVVQNLHNSRQTMTRKQKTYRLPRWRTKTDAENGGLVPEPGATLKLWDAMMGLKNGLTK